MALSGRAKKHDATFVELMLEECHRASTVSPRIWAASLFSCSAERVESSTRGGPKEDALHVFAAYLLGVSSYTTSPAMLFTLQTDPSPLFLAVNRMKSLRCEPTKRALFNTKTWCNPKTGKQSVWCDLPPPPSAMEGPRDPGEGGEEGGGREGGREGGRRGEERGG